MMFHRRSPRFFFFYGRCRRRAALAGFSLAAAALCGASIRRAYLSIWGSRCWLPVSLPQVVFRPVTGLLDLLGRPWRHRFRPCPSSSSPEGARRR